MIRENWKRLGQMKQQETPLKFQSLSLKNPSEIYPAESSADVDAKSNSKFEKQESQERFQDHKRRDRRHMGI